MFVLGKNVKTAHMLVGDTVVQSHQIVFLSAILRQSKSMTKILCYMLINPVSDSHHRRGELVQKPVS